MSKMIIYPKPPENDPYFLSTPITHVFLLGEFDANVFGHFVDLMMKNSRFDPESRERVQRILDSNYSDVPDPANYIQRVMLQNKDPLTSYSYNQLYKIKSKLYNLYSSMRRFPWEGVLFLYNNGVAQLRFDLTPPTVEQITGGVFGNTAMTGTFGNPNPTFSAFGNAGNTIITPTARIRTQPPPNRSNERVGVKELAIRKAAIRGGVLTNRNRRYIEQIESENPPFKVNNPDSYNYLDVITHIPVQRRTGDLSSHAYMVNQMIKHAYEDNHITLPKLTDITEDWEFDADSPREAYEEALTMIPFHNNLLDLNKNKKKR